MDLGRRRLRLFEASIEIKPRLAGLLAEPFTHAAELVTTSLAAGGRILACGNRGSAGHTQEPGKI